MNKNIILEVDESTRQMVDHIKSSILTDFSEKVESVKKSLSGDLSTLFETIDNLERNKLSKRDLENLSDEFSDRFEDLIDDVNGLEKTLSNLSGLQDLLSKIHILSDFIDTIASLRGSLQNIGSLVSQIDRQQNGYHDQFENWSKQATDGLEVISQGILSHNDKIASLTENITSQASIIQDSSKSVEVLIKSTKDAISNIINGLSEVFSSRINSLSDLQSERYENLIHIFDKNNATASEQLSNSVDEIKTALHNWGAEIERTQQVVRDTVVSEINDIGKTVSRNIESKSTQGKRVLDEATDQLEKSINRVSDSLAIVQKDIDELYKNHESFRVTITDHFIQIDNKIGRLSEKMDELVSLSKSNQSSIMERLKQILILVTPFWKRKKIDE